jgi:RHS repeat-associated protein
VRGVAAWSGGTLKKDYRTTLALANPWGTTPADTGTALRFRWAGREYDQETGLYYLRARYYDPQLGRFLSEDPAGIAGGLDLYTFVGDDPVNRTDPSGLGGECAYNEKPVTIDLPEGGRTTICLPIPGAGITVGEIQVQGNHGPPETLWGPGVPPMPVPPMLSGDPTASKGQNRQLNQPGQRKGPTNSCGARATAAANGINVDKDEVLGMVFGGPIFGVIAATAGVGAVALVGTIAGVPGLVVAIPVLASGFIGAGTEGYFYGAIAGAVLGPQAWVQGDRIASYLGELTYCMLGGNQ